MALHKYLRKAWKNKDKALWQKRLIKWRKSPSTLRIKHPTRLDRARSLGYKAKKGYFVVRQKLLRSRRQKPTRIKGRRSKRMSRRKDLNLTYKTVAEQRVAKKYPNCTVLGSYFLSKDSNYYWFEVILKDEKAT